MLRSHSKDEKVSEDKALPSSTMGWLWCCDSIQGQVLCHHLQMSKRDMRRKIAKRVEKMHSPQRRSVSISRNSLNKQPVKPNQTPLDFSLAQRSSAKGPLRSGRTQSARQPSTLCTEVQPSSGPQTTSRCRLHNLPRGQPVELKCFLFFLFLL